MTKEEAILAMKAGKKVTHRYFLDDEFLGINKEGLYYFEDGVICSENEFWKHRTAEWFNDGWGLFTEPLLRADIRKNFEDDGAYAE